MPLPHLRFLAGADHMVFSGRRWRAGTAKATDAAHLRLTCEATTLFWDAHLKGQAPAREALEGQFAAELAGQGVMEQRHR
jgi:hypothetical protein